MNSSDTPNFDKFVFPETLLDRIFEMTGGETAEPGFVLAYVSSDGTPFICSKSSSQIVEMGLRKALEQYLSDIEELENRPSGLDGIDE